MTLKLEDIKDKRTATQALAEEIWFMATDKVLKIAPDKPRYFETNITHYVLLRNYIITYFKVDTTPFDNVIRKEFPKEYDAIIGE